MSIDQMASRPRWRGHDDSGFTLLEVISTCLLASILLGLAVTPFKEYQRKSEHQGATRTVVAALRTAQVASVSEGVSYGVAPSVDGKSLTVSRLGATTTVIRTVTMPHSTISLSSPTFQSPSGASTQATFYPRGSATPGYIDITREGSTKSYRIKVEGLTGRVSYDE